MSIYKIFYKEKQKALLAVESEKEFRALRGTNRQKDLVERARLGETDAKKKLLQFNYSCIPAEDGLLKGCKTPSKSVGMDIDGELGDTAWEEATKAKILAKKDELGLLMLERSATKGFHLVFSRIENMTQEENLRWASELIGVKYDEGAADITRVFYSTTDSEEDLIFLSPELFVNEKASVVMLDDDEDKATEIAPVSEAKTEVVEEPTSETAYDPDLMLGELYYRDIAAGFFEKKGYGREPQVGKRHAALVAWVNAAFGQICDNDKTLMLRATPRLGKPEKEVVDIVNSVDAYHNKHFKPYESRLIRQVIAELEAQRKAALASGDLPPEQEGEELPPLPPPMQALVDICPEEFKIPMLITVLIMFGELLCRLRSKLNAYETEYPGFFYVIEAPMGGGKRFIEIAKNLILPKAIGHDREEGKAFEEYSELKEQHANDTKWVAPKKPKPVYMLGPNKVSPSELMKEAKHNQGVGILTISEEIDTHTNSTKSGTNRDTSDMERIAWDGGTITQRYASDGTVYGSADLFLSFIFTGTPKAVDRAFPDAENGLVSRYIYDYIDTRFKPKPVFKELSRKDKNMIARYAEKAYRTCFDEEGNVKPEQMVDLSWALPAIDKWIDEYLALACATKNVALDTFRRRPPKMALRAMMVVNWLWGGKKSHREDVIKFGLWFADHAIDSQMKRYSDMLVEQDKPRIEIAEKGVQGCKTNVLFNSLPNDFTLKDVEKNKDALSMATPATTLVFKFKQKGLIKKTSTKTYRKIG